jgi:hypothetical protein
MDYMFHNMGRIGQDKTDNSQRNVQNTRFAQSTVANYFSDGNQTLRDTVKFASQQPTMIAHGVAHGHGLNGNVVDYESVLLLRQEQERPLEKLMLNPRPFLTVPYLGRGAFHADVEDGLHRGNMVWEPKSQSTIMSKSFMDYTLPPDHEKHAVTDIEEEALDGWQRGGHSTRTAQV